MKIEYDPDKRAKTLAERGLDFDTFPAIWAGPTISIPDDRVDYGESRTITIGLLDDRMVVVVWTRRRAAFRIISMRKANDRERALFADRLRFG